jgi:hypothetical protein
LLELLTSQVGENSVCDCYPERLVELVADGATCSTRKRNDFVTVTSVEEEAEEEISAALTLEVNSGVAGGRQVYGEPLATNDKRLTVFNRLGKGRHFVFLPKG